MVGIAERQGVDGMNQYAKLISAGALFASLLYLVITGKMSPGDYQTLAVGALGALGGYHAGRFPNGGSNP